jgi:selenide,water dikinase
MPRSHSPNPTDAKPRCRLVLAGAGHAHLEVLRRLGRRQPGGIDLTVVSPGPAHHYSGMVPGYLGGTYRLDEIAVELAPLVERAGGRLLLGRAVGLDPRRRVVKVVKAGIQGMAEAETDPAVGAGGETDLGAGTGGEAIEVPYDLVAFAVGSDAAGAAAAAARAGGAVLSCKPIGRVVELRRRLDSLAAERRRPETVAVVGGGAAGVEIALAVAARFDLAAASHRVVLLEAGPEILAGRSPGFRRRAAQLLERRGIAVHVESRVVEVEYAGGSQAPPGPPRWPTPSAPPGPPGPATVAGPPGSPSEPSGLQAAGGPGGPSEARQPPPLEPHADAILHLAGDRELRCSLAVWVTAAVGWPLFRDSGLPLDGRGFLLIDDALRSVADPRVFAAGDCGTLAAFPHTAKAGVYAVREGPVLYRSLLAAVAGHRPPRYRPQRGFMIILNTSDGRALLSYQGATSYSRWAFRLKDRIDRGFLARYRPDGPGPLREGR